MSKGDHNKKDRNRVSVDGPWLAMPCEFLASRACAELSPLAMKMLVMLMGQLRAGGRGNGRIDAHPNTRKAAGWTSTASAQAALQELIDAALVVRTRQGAKGRLALYGITLFPMHCTRDDLDVGAGAWSVKDWRSKPQAEDAPTVQKPAVWRRPREARKRDRTTRYGNEMTPHPPATGTQLTQKAPCIPLTGTHPEDSAESAFPPRDSPSREPSAGAGCQLSSSGLPIGRLLAARTRSGHDRHPRERWQVTAAAAEFASIRAPTAANTHVTAPDAAPAEPCGDWATSTQGEWGNTRRRESPKVLHAS